MLYVVSIGIDRYSDNDILPLNHACDDAKSFGKLFEDGVHPAERDVHYLLNEDATRDAINATIGERLPRTAKDAEDIVILYFAGHGSPETDGSPDQTSRYLVTHDTRYDSIFSTGIDLERDLQRLYERIYHPKLLIMFIDSCFSGRAGGRTFEGPSLKKARAQTRAPLTLQDFDLGEGRIMISACDDDQVARESIELGHGYFTHALLDALTGEPAEKPTTISITEVYDRVSKKVRQLSRGRQEPILKGRIKTARLPIIPKQQVKVR